ncbi:nose resistant to fluoxetine protein 6 isoform X2 [Plutella xylostella]|uniref:nose resistant to fluoxetine protein 6 isoform X2 n=1 Tax=Plutella xylostella TaxID=51655 RepID=UPI0020322826|nr:nose resistant to fluoxetine protein 6 isoform X2 [Plutella xylostella]
MKCHNLWLAALCAVNTWMFAGGSLVKINDTVLASLPPLFALQRWAACQRPGDRYCLLEAELVAGPPDLLLTLQEYSAQTDKHYNRSRIHRGVCVTRCGGSTGGAGGDGGGAGDEAALQQCVNQTLYEEYGLQASLLSVSYCSTAGAAPPPAPGARALGVLTLVLGVLAALATALHAVGDRCARQEKILSNKYLLAFSIKKNWEIITYDRSRPRQDQRMSDLACLEGIRVLAIECVIFSHVLFMYIYSYTDNPEYVEKMYDTFAWQSALNSPLWLQAFLAMSGFLTAYSLLLCAERKPYTVVKCAVAIVTRWVRLTPTALYALWFTMAWFPALGSGPQWGWLVAREAQDCADRWWVHALYAHNHLPRGKFCMGHTWYLAVDMQLHILGTLLLLVCLRWRRAAWPLLALLMVLTVTASGLTAYLYDLKPIITAQAPENLRSLFLDTEMLSLLYLPAWLNLPGYVGGVAVALILHGNQKNGVKLAESVPFNILFHLSLLLGSCCVLGGSVFLEDAPPPRWASVLYSTFDRTICAVTFSVFMLGCVSRCHSALRDMFDWRGFHSLGRLSYCAFLIHFIVLRLTLASDTRLQHVSIVSCLTLFITTSILTYLASIPLCLLVELPFTQLWKAVVEAERPVDSPTPEPVDQGKPFDLVATVDGRHVLRE